MQRYKFSVHPETRQKVLNDFELVLVRSRVRRGRIVALCENTGLASISIVRRDSAGGKFNNLRMNLTFLN